MGTWRDGKWLLYSWKNIPFSLGVHIILQHLSIKETTVAKTFAQAKGNKAFAFCQLMNPINSEEIETDF